MRNLVICVAICIAAWTKKSVQDSHNTGKAYHSDLQFVLYGYDGNPTNASIGIVFAKSPRMATSKARPLLLDGTKSNRECLYDRICRSNGYQGYVDNFGLDVNETLYYKEASDKLLNLIRCDINCKDGWKSGPLNVNWTYSYKSPHDKDRKVVVLACKPKPEECKIAIQKGILDYVRSICHGDGIHDLISMFKCYNSLHYYFVIKNEKSTRRFFSNLCPNDTLQYQACYDSIPIPTSSFKINESFCLSELTPTTVDNFTRFTYTSKPFIGEDSKNYTSCNGVCETTLCVDESQCNGFQYGMYCNGTYVPPLALCGGSETCSGISDEKLCSPVSKRIKSAIKGPWGLQYIRIMKLCLRLDSQYASATVMLRNWTRCSALGQAPIPIFIRGSNKQGGKYLDQQAVPLCLHYIDQTNCSDPDRVALSCKIGGQLSTVSKLAVCVQDPGLCDNGLDSTCIEISINCVVHKHLLCNGISECMDKADETSWICNTMTATRCHRVYRHDQELRIPINWLLDGFQDCLNGIDEQTIWPTCGSGALIRLATDKGSCEDVFLCNTHSLDFVQLQDLCQVRNICDHARLCSQTPPADYIYPNPVTLGARRPTVYLLYCVAGISRSLSFLKGRCNKDEFNPFPVFGLSQPPYVVTPKSQIDCKNVFGKAYVYLTCMGKCKSTETSNKCPLKVLPYQSCSNSLKRSTLAHTTYMRKEHILANSGLTVIWEDKKTGHYFNDVFQCRNNICINSNKICNLVDDCGDFSDEENCINNFACGSPKTYITRSQKCDGKIDCADYSDECNGQCKKVIIKIRLLKTLSWIIGGMAILLNSIKLAMKIKSFATQKFNSSLNNQALTTAIHFGDLLTGLYLLSIAFIDSIVYGESYCLKQTEWIASAGCAFLGIFSTFGTHLSLFSMTLLSIFRVMGIERVQRVTSYHPVAKCWTFILLIAVFSAMVAVMPLLTIVEDIFVNGMTYNPKIKVFSAIVTKKQHLEILKKYFGRIPENLPWRKINRLIDMMFSQEYDSLHRRKIHFYGNDGVCLFKYFVKKGESQELYVWVILMLNFTCFIVILVCYTIVLCTSKRSFRRVRKVNRTGRRDSGNRDQEKFQQHIAAIIFTDFICWVPFIFMCALHYFNIIDATSLYPLSSIVILPLNAAINPVVYDTTLWKNCGKSFKKVISSADFCIFRVLRNILETTPLQNSSHETINAVENNAGAGNGQKIQSEPEQIEMTVFSSNMDSVLTRTSSAMHTTGFTNNPRPINPYKAVDEVSEVRTVVEVQVIGREKYFFQFPKFNQNQISVRFLWPARKEESPKPCISVKY